MPARWAALLAFALLAGCSDRAAEPGDGPADGSGDPADGPGGQADPGQGAGAGGNGTASLPEPIHDERFVPAGADPFNWPVPVSDSCEQAVSTCFEYPFTVDAAASNVTVAATLAWGTESNDFDLLLYEGGSLLAEARTPPPSAAESWSHRVGPGDYRIVVVAWVAAADTFTLDASFAPA